MVCTATRRNIILGMLLAAAYALYATPSQAEELTNVAPITAPSDEAENQKRFAVEVKPLPMIVSILPGSAGIGGEFEAKMTRNFTVFADASYLHMRLTDKMLEDVQNDQSEDKPDSVAREMTVTSMAAGGRYYADAFADSWFAGAKVGGGTAKVNWAYAEERYDDESLFYMAGAEAGYRWLWESGFLIRLGFGFNATMIPHRDVTQVAATDASAGRDDIEDKTPTKKTTGSAAFDFGLGYTF